VIVDLRSDTVTKPTPAMRKAMAEADVGDDVYGEDPTVNRLQALMAERLGKEASLFVVSGSMANQIAVRVHTRPGDEVIVDATGHSFLYESGGLGGLSHVQPNPIAGKGGLLSVAQIEAAIRPKWDHYARTSLVIVEQTSNGGGGTLYSKEELAAIGALAKRRGLRFHLDGARLWNASVKSKTSLAELAAPADSVCVCFSKGLGAPIGSVIAGDRAFIEEAHRQRKMLGGGMRQVGILAAAALYAVEHHLDRLEQDHQNLRRLTEGLAQIDGLIVDPNAFPTNIAYVGTDRDATEVAARLRAEGVLVNAMGPKSIRAVTHLDVGESMIDVALERFRVAMRS
jgi:threonine aldolase